MLVCNNSIISCMMPMYMQSNEYIQLCERCDISAQQTITRSHGSVTSVVRATRQVNGRRQTYPSHHTNTP